MDEELFDSLNSAIEDSYLFYDPRRAKKPHNQAKSTRRQKRGSKKHRYQLQKIMLNDCSGVMRRKNDSFQNIYFLDDDITLGKKYSRSVD